MNVEARRERRRKDGNARLGGERFRCAARAWRRGKGRMRARDTPDKLDDRHCSSIDVPIPEMPLYRSPHRGIQITDNLPCNF
jgi:hypothetical protein